MEIMTFALIAVFRLYGPEEKVIPEPREFQSFDVQTLQQVLTPGLNRRLRRRIAGSHIASSLRPELQLMSARLREVLPRLIFSLSTKMPQFAGLEPS